MKDTAEKLGVLESTITRLQADLAQAEELKTDRKNLEKEKEKIQAEKVILQEEMVLVKSNLESEKKKMDEERNELQERIGAMTDKLNEQSQSQGYFLLFISNIFSLYPYMLNCFKLLENVTKRKENFKDCFF